MRLVVTQNITLDGVIDATEGWFTPSEGDDQADVLAVLQSWMEQEDAMLLGRRTFEEFRGYWPKQTDDETGITEQLNRVRKYVVSSTMDDPEWEHSTVVRDLLGTARQLRETPGQEAVVSGSMSLMEPLIEAGLVDEFRLFVHPVVLGRGKRLFETRADVTLAEARTFSSGIVLLRYES